MADTPRSRSEHAALFAVAIVAASIGMTRLHNTDLAHHLAVGRRIAHEGPFAAGYPHSPNARAEASDWNGEWLFRLGCWCVYDAVGGSGHGETALVVVKLALVVGLGLALAGLGARAGSSVGPAAAIAAMVTLVLASHRLMMRPELASYVLVALLARALCAIEERGYRARDVAWIGAIHVVWANVHSFWPLGWAMTAALLPRAWRSRGDAQRAISAGQATCALAAAMVAPLATPRPLEGFAFPFALAAQVRGAWGDYFRAFNDYAPTYSVPPTGAMFVLACWIAPPLALLACALRGPAGRRPVVAPWLVAVTVAPALAMVRLVPLALVVAIPMLARALAWRLPRESRAVRAGGPLLAGVVAWLTTSAFATGAWQIAAGLSPRPGIGSSGTFNPADAIAALRALGPRAAIFNDPNSGGALELAGFPAWVDNNPQAFDPAFLARYARVLRGQDDFTAYARQHDLGAALILYHDDALWPLVGRLFRTPGWHLVYQDGWAVVFVDDRAAHAEAIATRAVGPALRARDALARGPDALPLARAFDAAPPHWPLVPWARVADPVPEREEGRLYRSLGLDGLAAAAFTGAVAASPADARLWTQLAEALLALDRGADGERALERALAVSPEHAPALYNLGLARYDRDPAAGLALIERACAAAPDVALYADALARLRR